MTRDDALTESAVRRLWCVLLAASLIAFTAIALDVGSGPWLRNLDRQATQHLLVHGPGAWTDFMRWLARVHGVAGIAVVGTLSAAWLWHRGRTRQLASLALIVGGGLALNSVLKRVFQRQRPVFDDSVELPLDTLATYSFPSGHVSGSVVFYGFVLMAIFARTTHRGWRIGATMAASVMVTLIAYNRVYVGAHFVSDVLAAVFEGLAWMAFCALLLERWRPRPAV